MSVGHCHSAIVSEKEWPRQGPVPPPPLFLNQSTGLTDLTSDCEGWGGGDQAEMEVMKTELNVEGSNGMCQIKLNTSATRRDIFNQVLCAIRRVPSNGSCSRAKETSLYWVKSS